MHNKEKCEYTCPSFNSYCSDKLPEIAAKISEEVISNRGCNSCDEEEDERGSGVEFEFSAAEEFFNGPAFPVFNRRDFPINGELLPDHGHSDEDADESICIALNEWSIDDDKKYRRNSKSSSSSEACDELEGSKLNETTTSQGSGYRKISSTGSIMSFRRWKIRNLLRRSNSERKDGFVLFSSKVGGKSEGKEPGKALSKVTGNTKAKRKVAGGGKAMPPSWMAAHELYYMRANDRAKRRSYLPYKRELVGFFASVNRLGRI
ncbi:unnamed protein product [Cuscuta epithymum]|uniref:Uncharacterized protein n=1 Tax=Cuscuta epithymum TaxID=186058 RepID=A0AAV0EMD6_9ASTE|nr:unnamed protein product [Cuscuta epithymum]